MKGYLTLPDLAYDRQVQLRAFLGSAIPENRSRPPSQICRDTKLMSLPGFQDIDWSQCDFEAYPPCREAPGNRAGRVFEQIAQRPEGRVVVVAHHNLMQALLGGLRVENCVPMRRKLRGGQLVEDL